MVLKEIWNKLKGVFEEEGGYRAEEFRFEADISAEQWQQLPEPVQKAFFQMKGRADRLENQLEERNTQVQELQEDRHEEQKKKAWEQEQKLKRDEERKKKYIWYKDPNQSIVSAFTGDFFADDQSNPLTLWVGEVRQRTPNGLGFKFLLSSPDEDVDVWEIPKQPVPFQYYPHIFNSEDFVTNMELGKVPVYIDHEGRFMQPQMKADREAADRVRQNIDPQEKLNQMKKKLKQVKKAIDQSGGEEKEKLEEAKEQLERRIENFDPEEVEHEADIKKTINVDMNTLLENLDERSRTVFFDLYDRWMKERSKAKQAMVTAEKLLSKKKSSDLAATALREGREDALSGMEQFESNLEGMSNQLTDALAREKKGRVDASVAESVIEKLMSREENLEERIPDTGKPEMEQARAEIEDILDNLGSTTKVEPQPKSRKSSSEEEGGEEGGIPVKP